MVAPIYYAAASFADRRAATAGAVQLAIEHGLTRDERAVAGRFATEVLEDTPVNTSGPVESTILDLL